MLVGAAPPEPEPGPPAWNYGRRESLAEVRVSDWPGRFQYSIAYRPSESYIFESSS